MAQLGNGVAAALDVTCMEAVMRRVPSHHLFTSPAAAFYDTPCGPERVRVY